MNKYIVGTDLYTKAQFVEGHESKKYDNVVVSSSGHFGTNNTSFELLLYTVSINLIEIHVRAKNL